MFPPLSVRFEFRMVFMVGLALILGGCGTTTQKLGTEQLLMSDAVDNAISRIDFRYLYGRKVYLDTQYIKTIKGVGFVNADYIVSSLRQQLTAAHCLLQEDAQSAEIIVEPRVGALGTDGHEITYGIPQSNALATAATVLANVPAPTIPEISVGRNVANAGIAKVIVFAYDRETREPIWQSGVAKAESTSSSTWLLGAGPIQKGSIYGGYRFAGQSLTQEQLEKLGGEPPVERVGYDREHVFDHAYRPDFEGPLPPQQAKQEDDSVQQATHEEEAAGDDESN